MSYPPPPPLVSVTYRQCSEQIALPLSALTLGAGGQWFNPQRRQSLPTPMHYGNIFEYLSRWSEVQFLNIQKSQKIQAIQKPNLFRLHSRDLPEN